MPIARTPMIQSIHEVIHDAVSAGILQVMDGACRCVLSHIGLMIEVTLTRIAKVVGLVADL